MKKEIYLTNHSRTKMNERDISIEMIKKVVDNPDSIKPDKIDVKVLHLIKKIGNKFLRVLMRTDEDGKQIVITVFFDRRLRRS